MEIHRHRLVFLPEIKKKWIRDEVCTGYKCHACGSLETNLTVSAFSQAVFMNKRCCVAAPDWSPGSRRSQNRWCWFWKQGLDVVMDVSPSKLITASTGGGFFSPSISGPLEGCCIAKPSQKAGPWRSQHWDLFEKNISPLPGKCEDQGFIYINPKKK